MTPQKRPTLAELPTLTPEAAHEAGMSAAAWLALHLPAPPPPVAGWPEVYALTAEPEIQAQLFLADQWAADHVPIEGVDMQAYRYCQALRDQWEASWNVGTDLLYVSPARLERAEKYRDVALSRYYDTLAGPPAAGAAGEEARK